MQIETAEALGLTPLEYMLQVMNDSNEDPARRDWMAQAAAPYVHARLAPKAVNPDQPQTTEAEKAAADWNDLLN